MKELIESEEFMNQWNGVSAVRALSASNKPNSATSCAAETIANGDANYELSEDFQALSTRKAPTSRVRRRRNTKKEGNANGTVNGNNGSNTIIGTLSVYWGGMV